MTTPAGEKDRRIQIQQEQLVPIPGSHETRSEWLPFARPWAKKVAAGGRESLMAQQMASKISTVFRIHYLRDLSPTGFRVLDETGRIYDIVDVREPKGSRREEQELLCWARAEAL